MMHLELREDQSAARRRPETACKPRHQNFRHRKTSILAMVVSNSARRKPPTAMLART